MPQSQLTTFAYDPNRQPYDGTNVWKAVTGTPADSGGTLVFNAATGVHKTDVMFASVTEVVTVPAVPTASDVRQWGLKMIGYGAYAVFDVTDTTFSVKTSDGTTTDSQTIAFAAAWAAAATKFKIDWKPGILKYYINDTVVATVTGNAVPRVPMSLYFKNSNADAMALSAVVVRDIEQCSRVV